jgi:hypothetical protein
MGKPTLHIGPNTGIDLVIESSSGSKTINLGLTEDGVLTVDGVALESSEGDNYEEVSYDGRGRLKKVSIWSDNTKTTLLKEETLTYQGNSSNINNVITEFYDSSGTLVKTITETTSYDSNGRISSINRGVS